jgi:chaperonin GroES
LKVGYGNYNNEGNLIPATVKVGDNVLLPDYEGGEVKLEEKTYYVYRESDLLGILQ